MADRLIDLGVDVRVPFGILFFVFGNRECLLHAESDRKDELQEICKIHGISGCSKLLKWLDFDVFKTKNVESPHKILNFVAFFPVRPGGRPHKIPFVWMTNQIGG